MAETSLSQKMMDRIYHWTSKWIQQVIDWTSRSESSQCKVSLRRHLYLVRRGLDILTTNLQPHWSARWNPPWSLIPKILNRVTMFRCQVLMAVLFHQHAPW